MNTTDKKQTKRLMVDLFGHETMLTRRRIIVEIPADCDEEALKEIGGFTLDEIATQNMSDADWETEESESFETIDTISIKVDVPEHLDSDIVFEFDDERRLVTAERCF